MTTRQDVADLKSRATADELLISTCETNIDINRTSINTLINTTIPGLESIYLKIQDPNPLGTMTIGKIDNLNGTLSIGENAQTLNLGYGNDTDHKIINIGSGNDTVNIYGTTNYV